MYYVPFSLKTKNYRDSPIYDPDFYLLQLLKDAFETNKVPKQGKSFIFLHGQGADDVGHSSKPHTE
jgi:hypothetical protein